VQTEPKALVVSSLFVETEEEEEEEQLFLKMHSLRIAMCTK